MRAIFHLSVILLIPSTLNAQTKTPVLLQNNIIKVHLDNEPAGKKLANPIYNVNVIDARDDTSSLGYEYSNESKKYAKYLFDSAGFGMVKNFMSNYLSISGDNTNDGLLVCVRKLRISQEAATAGFTEEHEGQPLNGWEPGVLFKAEFYLQNGDGFYPLFRFDSIVCLDRQLPGKAPEFVTMAIKRSLNRLFEIDVASIKAKGKKITYETIINHNQSNTDVPILKATNLKYGVYESFEEFKKNDPSILAFEYKKGKFGDMLYVKKDGNEYPDRTAWGFCDGKNLFINSGDKFSELIRDCNTFYFQGIKSVAKEAKHIFMKSSGFNYLTNTGLKKTVYNVDNRYYQVDMETGKVY